jgi:hypothetical protein
MGIALLSAVRGMDTAMALFAQALQVVKIEGQAGAFVFVTYPYEGLFVVYLACGRQAAFCFAYLAKGCGLQLAQA